MSALHRVIRFVSASPTFDPHQSALARPDRRSEREESHREAGMAFLTSLRGWVQRQKDLLALDALGSEGRRDIAQDLNLSELTSLRPCVAWAWRQRGTAENAPGARSIRRNSASLIRPSCAIWWSSAPNATRSPVAAAILRCVLPQRNTTNTARMRKRSRRCKKKK